MIDLFIGDTVEWESSDDEEKTLNVRKKRNCSPDLSFEVKDGHFSNKSAYLLQSPLNPKKFRASFNILDDELVTVLDKCKLSDRQAVYVIYAVAKALKFNIKDLILNKKSIGEYRKKLRESQMEKIKKEFNTSDLRAVIVHFDGKILPTMNKEEKIERLPIFISYGKQDKLLGRW